MGKIIKMPNVDNSSTFQPSYRYEKIGFFEFLTLMSFYFIVCFSILVIIPFVYFYRWLRRKK